MNSELRQKIIKEWKIDKLPIEEKIIKLFEKVRDIPFGYIASRDPQDVYQSNKGTCSGKNLLLKELYKEIGVKTIDMISLQRWKDLTWFPTKNYKRVKFPKEIQQILDRTDVVDFHNFLKIFVNNKWVRVDVTIDKPLIKLGFFTTLNWDGKSDMPLCFASTGKEWNWGDKGLEEKKRLVSLLSEEIQKERTLFLAKMTEWIDSLREKGEI